MISTIDITIIISYLILTLVIGIIKGRGVKNIRDFAVSSKMYTTPVLVATIFGTIADGGSVLGITEKIITVGIIYLALFAGEPIVKLLTAQFIAPRMPKFSNMISAGDIMATRYGKPGRMVTGFAGFIVCVGYLGSQVAAFGYFFHYFTGISPILAIVVGSMVVVVYSAFGGIRAVTATDVFQLGIIVVAIPMIANVALDQAGGIKTVFGAFQESKFAFFPPGESKMHYLFLFVMFSMPFLNPAVLQRLLMAKDAKQIISSFRIAAVLDVPYYLSMGIIALCVILLEVDIAPNLALPYLISAYLPVGIKGVAIAGMFSVLMSSADSYLNAGSIAFIHDIVSPMRKTPLSTNAELMLTRIATAVIGLFAIAAAISFESILDMVLAFLNVWGPVIVVPLFGVIFGFKGTQRSFVISVGAAFVGFVSWTLWVPEIDALIPSMLISGTVFVLSAFAENKKVHGIKRFAEMFNAEEWTRRGSPKSATKMRNLVPKFNQYTTFCIFYLASSILPYFLWEDAGIFSSNFLVFLRFVGGVLCFGLILRDYMPMCLKKHLVHFWRFTLSFCLVITPMLIALQSGFDLSAILNFSISLLVLSLLTNWVEFIFITVIGVILSMVSSPFDTPINYRNLVLLSYLAGFSSLAGLIFSSSREKAVNQRMNHFRLMMAAVAHELRTPLASISLNAQGIKTHLPCLIEGYEKAQEQQLVEGCIDENHIDTLKSVYDRQESVTQKASMVINMLLTNLSEFDQLDNEFGEVSVKECVAVALESYPLEDSERQLIKNNIGEGFKFRGSQLLLTHILFNLLKNSLYHIRCKEGAGIEIWEDDENDFYHTLNFKDTGEGIKMLDLPHIFDSFYTRRENGTGVGLSFCKAAMEKMGAKIICNSVRGEYTHFKLLFPREY